MSGFFLDDKSNQSMARLIAFVVLCIGSIISIGGIAGWFMKLSDAPIVIGLGTAIISSGELLKWLQKKEEVKVDSKPAELQGITG